VTVAMAPIGGVVALFLTGTNFSVSSGIGFLALFGVSVQTGVIMVEYINQLRARGDSILDAAMTGAVLRFRPILMTMLVASLGLVPAATSHGIGSDSQRPFAIVIVGGLMAVFCFPACTSGLHAILTNCLSQTMNWRRKRNRLYKLPCDLRGPNMRARLRRMRRRPTLVMAFWEQAELFL
jgi:predicted RND superfamily exporter protein